MIRIFFLSQSSPILELFPFDKITLKSYICTVVTVMAKQCWSQTVLESGSWGHSVLQTPALVELKKKNYWKHQPFLHVIMIQSDLKYVFATSVKCFFTNWPKHILFVVLAFIPLLNRTLVIKS